jgi:hypothetical protein
LWDNFPKLTISTCDAVTPTLAPPAALSTALARILRPVVRLALAHGITYPALADMLKTLFVDVARRDFPLPDSAPSDSRINLLTGIHRKELKRLRETAPDLTEAMPESVSLGAQLVGIWTGKAPYLDPQGRPRPLPRLSGSTGAVSFESLVACLSKDIRSRVVLDEWLRLGIATLNQADEVVLCTEAFIPRAGIDELLYYFGHNLRDHAAAAVHNLLGEAPPLLERSVHYDALSTAGIEELRELAGRLGNEALQSLNKRALDLEARDAVPDAAKQRFTYGVYFYNEAAPGKGPDTP